MNTTVSRVESFIDSMSMFSAESKNGSTIKCIKIPGLIQVDMISVSAGWNTNRVKNTLWNWYTNAMPYMLNCEIEPAVAELIIKPLAEQGFITKSQLVNLEMVLTLGETSVMLNDEESIKFNMENLEAWLEKKGFVRG